jgi:Ala-tRNA(Pro) deacylase
MYLTDYLQSRRIPFESLLHPPASSATRRARSIHVPGSRVAKAVLIKTGESFAIAVLPATRRIDWLELSNALGCCSSGVRLATDQELAEVLPDCEPGVVPAFGRLYGLPTVVDTHLADESELIIGGNMRHEGLRIRFHDFETAAEPVRASFSKPTSTERRAPAALESDRLAG